MKSFATVALLVATIMVAHTSPTYRVRRIEITHPGEDEHSTHESIHGARPCGGPGRVVAFRVEGCSGGSICQVPADTPRPSELEFIPSEDIEELGIRINLVQDGKLNTVYEKPVANSAVEGGDRYIVNAKGIANKDLQGKTVTLQYILYRVSDGSVEVCSEADFEVV